MIYYRYLGEKARLSQRNIALPLGLSTSSLASFVSNGAWSLLLALLYFEITLECDLETELWVPVWELWLRFLITGASYVILEPVQLSASTCERWRASLAEWGFFFSWNLNKHISYTSGSSTASEARLLSQGEAQLLKAPKLIYFRPFRCVCDFTQ